MLVAELVDATWVAAITATASVAVDDDLWRKGNAWEGVVT